MPSGTGVPFVAMFSFCFAVSIGAVWEIYEFSFDGLLGLNMQKFLLADGTPLVGRAALTDTMKDIIVDTIGALIASLKRARQAQGDLRIAGVNDQVGTVLKLTNLDRVLRPFDSVEAATDGW